MRLAVNIFIYLFPHIFSDVSQADNLLKKSGLKNKTKKTNTVDGAKGKIYEYANLATLYNLVVSEICFIMQRSMLNGRQLGLVSSSSQSPAVIWAGTKQCLRRRCTFNRPRKYTCSVKFNDAVFTTLQGCWKKTFVFSWMHYTLSRQATVSGAQREDRC